MTYMEIQEHVRELLEAGLRDFKIKERPDGFFPEYLKFLIPDAEFSTVSSTTFVKAGNNIIHGYYQNYASGKWHASWDSSNGVLIRLKKPAQCIKSPNY